MQPSAASLQCQHLEWLVIVCISTGPSPRHVKIIICFFNRDPCEAQLDWMDGCGNPYPCQRLLWELQCNHQHNTSTSNNQTTLLVYNVNYRFIAALVWLGHTALSPRLNQTRVVTDCHRFLSCQPIPNLICGQRMEQKDGQQLLPQFFFKQQISLSKKSNF